jgi:hypothetical protein
VCPLGYPEQGAGERLDTPPRFAHTAAMAEELLRLSDHETLRLTREGTLVGAASRAIR